jgi:S-formylglutathione hydrolase FrmB
MVIPNGGKRSEYRDWPEQHVLAETMIIKELIPLVDSRYRMQAAPLGRAIEGMSMGGNGSLKLALKYPELFGSVLAVGHLRTDPPRWLLLPERSAGTAKVGRPTGAVVFG